MPINDYGQSIERIKPSEASDKKSPKCDAGTLFLKQGCVIVTDHKAAEYEEQRHPKIG
jgi:hypothetical protein